MTKGLGFQKIEPMFAYAPDNFLWVAQFIPINTESGIGPIFAKVSDLGIEHAAFIGADIIRDIGRYYMINGEQYYVRQVILWEEGAYELFCREQSDATVQ